MSYVKTNWVNDETELNPTNMNHIEDGIEKAYGVELLAVVDTAPSECVEGDKYFNTTTNKIYEATATDTWDTEGYDAESGVFYVVFSEKAIYTYNGTTLIGVGSSGAGGESIPVGSILAFAGSTAPEGYLMCDGSNVSRTANNELFNVIGTTYGTGDGSTTFGVPNIKGKVLVMLDTSQTEFDTLGETGGSKYLQKHTHGTYGNVNEGSTSGYGFNAPVVGNPAFGQIAPTTEVGTGNSGNLQPYIVVNYIIKAHPSAVNTSEVVNEHSTSETDVYSTNQTNVEIQNAMSGTSLYSDSTGSISPILSETSANYNKLDITFISSDYQILTTSIFKADYSSTNHVVFANSDAGSMYIKYCNYSVSSTSISLTSKQSYVGASSYGEQVGDFVKVIRVIGYK